MDNMWFDQIVSGLGTVGNRRDALRVLASGALAGVLATPGTTAAKRKKKKTCSGKGRCCKTRDCNRCARELCNKGRCQCSKTFKRQNGVCGRPPQCKSVGSICTSDFDCCSDECIPVDGDQMRCVPGTFQCITDFDCVSGPCRGFMCPEQYEANVGPGC